MAAGTLASLVAPPAALLAGVGASRSPAGTGEPASPAGPPLTHAGAGGWLA
jgi:hypothetical protein